MCWQELSLHYTVHTSLDVVEEKLAATNIKTAGGTSDRELYLGSLYTSEHQKVFGYVTNTKIKFVTEGILIREMMGDPLLSNYSVIMLDEVTLRY